MSDEMTTLPAVIEPTPLILIQQALEAKIPASELKGFFDLQVRAEQRQAEQAYADAITAFQSESPLIHKSKSVEGRYSYAPFEVIMQAILPLLRRHRIVVTFDTAEAEGKVQVTCRTRVGVVEKHTTVVLPVPPTNKLTNTTQTSVGAISYGKRTALVAALNLICTDEDHSGEEVYNNSVISEAQANELTHLLSDLSALGHHVKLGVFCNIYGVDALWKIPASRFNDARTEALRAIDTQKKKNAARAAKEGGQVA